MSSSSSSGYGENIVVNGTFNGNANGWILSGGMKYEDYHVVAEQNEIYVKKATQYVPITSESTYLVQYNVIISGSASSSFSIGNTYVSCGSQQGTISSFVTVSDTQPLIISAIVQSGKIYITDVSIREILYESSSSSSSSQSSFSTPSTSSSSRIKTTSSSDSSSSSSSQFKTTSSSSRSSYSSQTISLTSDSQSSSSQSSSSQSSTISEISSQSSISISSRSSISSSSVSSSSYSSLSTSSISSSSVSSITSRSSGSSSSSAILSTSSSLSSLSSLSSSSSLNKGHCLVPFMFEASNGKQI